MYIIGYRPITEDPVYRAHHPLLPRTALSTLFRSSLPWREGRRPHPGVAANGCLAACDHPLGVTLPCAAAATILPVSPLSGQGEARGGGLEVETLDVEGGADLPIELPISHGPATGYSWTLELPDGVRMVEPAPRPDIAPRHEAGAPAAGNLRVAAPAGEYEVFARFARPWEDQPLREVRLRLHVR